MSTSTIDEWDSDDRRRFRLLVVGSVVAHAIVVVLLGITPPWASVKPGIPGVVVVDVVTMAPGVVPGPPAAEAPAPPAPKPPAPKPPAPKAEPISPPKPPPPVQKQVVLPKEAQAVPKPQAKATEKAPPKPAPAKTPPKQLDYEDLMNDLRAETGEARPAEVAQVRTGARTTPGAVGVPGGGGGGTVKVSPEVMAWIRDARIHVRKAWVKTPGFERLQTTLLVMLDDAGNVVGEPKVAERSGNPFYDDAVVRAIQKASPLPKPPRAGEWPFVFPSEEG